MSHKIAKLGDKVYLPQLDIYATITSVSSIHSVNGIKIALEDDIATYDCHIHHTTETCILKANTIHKADNKKVIKDGDDKCIYCIASDGIVKVDTGYGEIK